MLCPLVDVAHSHCIPNVLQLLHTPGNSSHLTYGTMRKYASLARNPLAHLAATTGQAALQVRQLGKTRSIARTCSRALSLVWLICGCRRWHGSKDGRKNAPCRAESGSRNEAAVRRRHPYGTMFGGLRDVMHEIAGQAAYFCETRRPKRLHANEDTVREQIYTMFRPAVSSSMLAFPPF